MEKIIVEKLPCYIINIANQLRVAGFSCFLVGGPVRDILIGKDPDDFDLATDASPEQIENIFPKSITTGAKFGTVIVLEKDSLDEHHSVEITTFRSESEYVDGRWPSKVEFTTDLEKDLGRRDFTINAMAINLQTLNDGVEDNDVIDLFGGMKDVNRRLIRAVGTPQDRMEEDGLRAFRACRLASELNYQIDEETFSAIKNSNGIAKRISIERIRNEFVKLLMKSPKPSYGINLMKDCGLLELFLPELLEGIGVEQSSQYHVEDVYNHILSTVDVSEDSVKLAALFHDIGKPRCLKKRHFYEHDIVSAEMTREIMKRMKFPKIEIERTASLVRWHMFIYADWREGGVTANWSDSAIRRLIKNVGGQENIDDLIKLRIADALSNKRSSFNPGEIRLLQARIAELREQDMILRVEDLDITGKDLINLGFSKGPKIGEILTELLEEVIDNPELNDKEKLIKLAKSFK